MASVGARDSLAVVMDSTQLLAALNWRHAVKNFDPSRRIPDAEWAALEESLALTPSSYGLQPWRFLVVTEKEIRERLVPYSWGQRQVADASHLVVFLARTSLDESDIDHHISRTAEVRGVAPESLSGFREMMVKDLVRGARSAQSFEWAKCQVYIALGQFMLAAAMLGIDTCPMEGFNQEKYTSELGLADSGWTPVVLCPAGFRAAGDDHARRPKVRFPVREVVVERV